MNAIEQSRLRSLQHVPLAERSALPFRKDILKIANVCLATAFKGDSIAPLTTESVRVVRDQSFAEYTGLAISTLVHSSSQDAKPTKMKNTVDAAVMPLLPNRPIWVSESYLAMLIDIDPKITDFMLANTLIHELLHRLAQPKVIELASNQPMLETIGLSSFQHQILTAPNDRARQRYLEDYKSFLDSFKDNEPALLVDGAMIQVISGDVNGTRGIQTASGYDLNEGFAEFLAREPRKVLEQQMRKTLKTRDAQFLVDTFSKNSGATIQRECIDMAEMAEITKSLGLHDIRQVLKAVRRSIIPELWHQHRPGELYP